MTTRLVLLCSGILIFRELTKIFNFDQITGGGRISCIGSLATSQGSSVRSGQCYAQNFQFFNWVNLGEFLGLARKQLALGVHDSSFVMFIYINVARELIENKSMAVNVWYASLPVASILMFDADLYCGMQKSLLPDAIVCAWEIKQKCHLRSCLFCIAVVLRTIYAIKIVWCRVFDVWQ